MNTLFGIGFSELIVILILVFIVIGPERTQQTARKAGQLLGKLLRSKWWSDFQTLQKNIRDLPNTLVRMAEIEELQQDLKQSLHEIQSDIKTETNEISQELNKINHEIDDIHPLKEARTILPPDQHPPQQPPSNQPPKNPKDAPHG